VTDGANSLAYRRRSKTLQQPPNHHLAQLNIGRIRYEIGDPRDSGHATSTRPYADRRIIVNFSVWENVAALEHFVWQTVHKRFYGRRADWFEHFDGPSVALWWVPIGHRPSVEEALARIAHLKQHGPSDHAFDWQTAAAQLWKTARCSPAGQAA
jgi:uncharacterized protein DUF3291